MNTLERDKYFTTQYLHRGGFCSVCGEGIKPILNGDIETFGLCSFRGKHLREQRSALKEKLGKEDKQPIWDALNNSDA